MKLTVLEARKYLLTTLTTNQSDKPQTETPSPPTTYLHYQLEVNEVLLYVLIKKN
ncbi:unnamed protein product [Brugia timori]|uniref:Bm14455 n=2 Tax=Brugia TaxID=6278 RepID=A0A1I9G0S4_BRUMA|nr:Bm14455 [Brugia malayi]VDO26273.1 unnamed protein product [Brugia timori]